MNNKISISVPTLIALLMLAILPSLADSEIQKVVVFAEPCLNIREKDDRNSKVIGCIPYFSIINISVNLDHLENQDERIDAEKLYSITYKGLEGYVLGKYLVDARYFSVPEAGKYNNHVRILLEGEQCGDVNYSPELNWYGVYPTDKDNYQELKKVKITIKTPNTFIKEKKTQKELNYSGSRAFFVIETDVRKKSLFLIGLKDSLREGMISGVNKITYKNNFITFEREFLYPEQSKELKVENIQPLFIKAKEDAFIDDYKKLTIKKQYEIEIAKEYFPPDRSIESQRLTPDIPEVLKTSYYDNFQNKTLLLAIRKNPILVWYGDIDQDKKMDLLFFSYNMPDGGDIVLYLTLFLSSKAEGHNFVKKVSELWFGCDD